ncbi:hypothetical protein JHK84_056870 [Glycine max]|nr:hypothetical protein JHK84_056870 [Glycine max]
MALVPTRPFFDSFHSSPNFHSLRFCNSLFRHSLTPSPNSTFLRRKPLFIFRCNPAKSFSTDKHWLKRWNDPTNNHARPKPPCAVLDYSENGHASKSGLASSDEEGGDGNTGGSTMDRIVEKLKKFGYVEDGIQNKERVIEKGSVEDIFYVEEGMLPNSRGGFSSESPLGFGSFGSDDGKVRFPWEKPVVEELEERKSMRSRSKTPLAELTLPESELKRLLKLTFEKKHKTRIGRSGVTQAVVDKIHERWKTSEIVRLKFEGEAALNMKRMHEILEVWCLSLVDSVFRKSCFCCKICGVHDGNEKQMKSENSSKLLPTPSYNSVGNPSDIASNSGTSAPLAKLESTNDEKERDYLPKVNYEHEVDKLLDGLGPRYTDWPGCDPLPVDADMLPVALKRGVQLTTSERMAEEIKKLTGGILLSRNKDFLVFFRGKNFLSADVTQALLERERMAKVMQDEEEQARLRASSLLIPTNNTSELSAEAGTLGETLDADAKWGKTLDERHKQKIMREVEQLRHANLVKKLEQKLSFHDCNALSSKGFLDETLKLFIELAERKLRRAEKALMKVESFLKPSEYKADPESITDEERFMFRKLGLRMKAFLLLGRRGVFDGTIENMHLHWKYRELVKIIVKAKTFEQVKKIALALEAESGGVLVSVDKVSKGYSVIVYRGKDYQRPSTLRPKNLLTKRKALARSIELQRHEVEDGEQGDEAYLKTYNSENDSEFESEVESDNMYPPI